MGGQNCPPPGIDQSMPEMRTAYVHTLAQYCQDLFGGAESYFTAHVKIEGAVMTEGSLDEAISSLTQCEARLDGAKSRIGAVASLYEQLGGGRVDFRRQFEQIESAMRAVGTARMELELLGESGGV